MSIKTELPTVWQEQWHTSGYGEPTAIQNKMYAPILAGENCLGISPTGTGKTVAYVLPLIQQVTKQAGLQVLILLPSQELAMQVFQVVQLWGKALDLTSQAIIGGANMKRQVEKLKQKPEIIVGTPGRLVELTRAKKIKLHQLRAVVLDEVDQLLAASEFQGATTLLQMAPKNKQVIAVSATGGQVVEEVERLVTGELTVYTVTQTSEATSSTVAHGYLAVEGREKVSLLRRLARQEGIRAVVFFNQLSELGAVAEKLNYEQVPIATLASDEGKVERQTAIQAFHAGEATLLLTTEVAARGLDFKDLPLVIHYECPYTPESYLHRSGRTGRMGQKGQVLTFISSAELRDYQRLLKGLAIPITRVVFSHGKIQVAPQVAPKPMGSSSKRHGQQARVKDKRKQ